MDIYRYYCAETEDGRHFCFMAKDAMEAAYRADYMCKEWYKTTLKDVFLDRHDNPHRRYKPYDQEILSEQLQ